MYFCQSHGQQFVNGALFSKHKQTAKVRSSQRKEKTTLPKNGPGWIVGTENPKHLDRTTGVLNAPPGPRTFILNLSSPIPAARGASDHGRLPQERGGLGLGEETTPLASWLSCRLLQLYVPFPHHPGFGKCSWSLLVGCKGKKNPS